MQSLLINVIIALNNTKQFINIFYSKKIQSLIQLKNKLKMLMLQN